MNDEFELKDGKLVIRSIAFLNDDFTQWFSDNFMVMLNDFLEYNDITVQDLIDRWNEFKGQVQQFIHYYETSLSSLKIPINFSFFL